MSADDAGFLEEIISSLELPVSEKRARLAPRFFGVLSEEEGLALPAVLLVGGLSVRRKNPIEEGLLVAAAASRAKPVDGRLLAAAGLSVS